MPSPVDMTTSMPYTSDGSKSHSSTLCSTVARLRMTLSSSMIHRCIRWDSTPSIGSTSYSDATCLQRKRGYVETLGVKTSSAMVNNRSANDKQLARQTLVQNPANNLLKKKKKTANTCLGDNLGDLGVLDLGLEKALDALGGKIGSLNDLGRIAIDGGVVRGTHHNRGGKDRRQAVHVHAQINLNSGRGCVARQGEIIG